MSTRHQSNCSAHAGSILRQAKTRIMSRSSYRNAVRPALRFAPVVMSLFLAACGGSGDGCDYGGCATPSAGNPTVTLASVATNVNRTVTLTATPTAPNGVSRVDFLIDGASIASATTAPFTANWNTSTATDGSHTVAVRVTDAQGLTATTPAVSVTVANTLVINVSLAPREEFPVPTSTASGTGSITVNLVTGAVSGNFTLTGMTATAAHIHDAFAGSNGPVVVGFAANATVANRWDLPLNALLTATQVDHLLSGSLYVNAHSAAYPAGEIRAQIKPASVIVVHANMTGDQEVPAVTTTASGMAAVTVDTVANVATIHLNSQGVNDSNNAHIHTAAAGASGPVLIPLTKDAANPAHWSAVQQAVTATALTDFNANRWYANIHTPANAGGEIRGQINATAPVATTLTQLQTTIFTPSCAGCHTGTGATLPGSMNLSSAASSYAALVGVASIQQNTLQRVTPNNPANSYLIRKLEGTAGISGSRMPLGGPFLSQTTIDTVKSWINNGAPNN